MRRFGQVIRLKAGCEEEYARHHAAVWPEVAATIRSSGIGNYSIFMRDGFLFGYFEYQGDDFEVDMLAMARCEATQKWWAIMENLQEPVESAESNEWWATMKEVFHQD